MIITQHVDNRRSGANIGETGLRPNNVNANRFGRVFELPVMGAIYAQPLVAPGIRVGGRLRNVLFVATHSTRKRRVHHFGDRVDWGNLYHCPIHRLALAATRTSSGRSAS